MNKIGITAAYTGDTTMDRRSFTAAFVGVLLTPFSFLRGKPVAATGPTGCPKGDRGKEGPPGVPPGTPWYNVANERDREELAIHEFMQEFDCVPPEPVPESAARLIDVDHGLLAWHGPVRDRKYTRAPFLAIEHEAREDWDDGKLAPKLVVDQFVPCRAVELDVFGSQQRDYPIEPQMYRVMEFDLCDPYQLLLADLLIRGLIDKGVVRSDSFIHAWNQAVIDSQNRQFSKKVQEDDPDAPTEFIAGTLMRTIQAGHGPSSSPEGAGGRYVHTKPTSRLQQKLDEHHAALEEQERRQRQPGPFARKQPRLL
jgi:hypothetical protein